MPGELTYDESALLARLALGDEAAFARIFHRHRDLVYSVALRLTRSPTLSEEVVQDVFLKIWMKREQLRQVEDFKNYLFIVSRNHIFSALKQLARRQGATEEYALYLPVSGDTTYGAIFQQEYEGLLQQAIERLPPQQKQVYLMSREQSLKRVEIAARLQLSPETVKVHLARAMRFIRAYCLSRLEILLFGFNLFSIFFTGR